MRSLLARAALLALVLTALPHADAVHVETVPTVVDATVGVRVPTLAPVPAADTADGVPVEGSDEAYRSQATVAPLPFSMIGFELPDGIDTVRVRTAGDDGDWSEWYAVDRMQADEGPDPDSEEAGDGRALRFTDPAWVGEATRFQIELDGDEVVAAVTGPADAGVDAPETPDAPDTPDAADPTAASDGGVVAAPVLEDLGVEATVIDTEGLSGGPVERRVTSVPAGPSAEAQTPRPSIVSRSSWGAQAPRRSSSIAANVDLVVVHHTAGSNTYSREQAAGQVRGIQSYHRNTLGWNDVGYNVLVDRFGRLYEGRAGGLDRGVVGAHAANFNTGSFGVSVMGNFVGQDAPQAAYDAMYDVIAWKASIHGFDPLGTTTRTRNGARVRTVVGHREVGQTACPGRIQDRMWQIRTVAAERTVRVKFPDVGLSSPHRANVLALDGRGVLRGGADGRFRPAAPLTRGQLASIVAGAARLPAVGYDGRFRDVPADHTHAASIAAVVDAGIVEGVSRRDFAPDRAVARDQMATFLANARGLSDAAPTFRDVPRTNRHRGAIGALQAAGIARGDGSGNYGPRQSVRRDQAASLIHATFPG